MLDRVLKPMAGAQPGARSAVALLLAINLFNYIDRYVLAAVEPLIRREFFPAASPGNAPATDDSRFWMGLLATAFLVSYMVAAPVFGWLADRFNRWTIIGAGVIVWSLASGGSGLASIFAVLLLMRVFVGIGEAAYGPAAPTLIADLYPVERRGQVLAWFYVALPVGSALGYILGGALAAATSWHWAFLVTLPPGIILGLLCFRRPEPPRGGSDASFTGAHPHASLRDYLALLRNRSYVLNVAGMTAFTFAIGGIAFWAPTYFFEHRGFFTTQGEAGLAKVNQIFGGIMVVAGITSTLFGGWLADRLRPRVPRAYLLVSGAGVLCAIPFFLGVLYLPMVWSFVCMFAAIFFLFLSTGPTNTAIANATAPTVRATAYALCIFVIHAFGDAISPPIIGLITDRTTSLHHPHGNMTFAFLVLSVMIFLSGVLWCLAPEPIPPTDATEVPDDSGPHSEGIDHAVGPGDGLRPH